MESIFADILKQAPSTAIILVVLYLLVRRLLDDTNAIRKRMDCFEKSQHACQLDVAREYATKKDLDKESERIDSHESRISKLEGRR